MSRSRARASTPYRPKTTRLVDQAREVLRYHHYAYKTEQTYVSWIVCFIRFNGIRHPSEMGKSEIERFLSHLAINRAVSAAAQNPAMNAIPFVKTKRRLGHSQRRTLAL
jgi:hypothetical protein